jgi:hypothetical protein
MADDERIVIDRLSAAYRYGYAIVAHCDGCGRSVYLNLPTVIALDGDRNLLDLRVRCQECRRRGTIQLVPLSTMGGYSYPRH